MGEINNGYEDIEVSVTQEVSFGFDLYNANPDAFACSAGSLGRCYEGVQSGREFNPDSAFAQVPDLGRTLIDFVVEVADRVITRGLGNSATAIKQTKNAKNALNAGKDSHGNKADSRPATLYEKYDKDGNFQKHGVTKHEDPTKRYTAKQIDGGTVVRTDRGPRVDMLRKERDLVERQPGPDNREPWAGKRLEK